MRRALLGAVGIASLSLSLAATERPRERTRHFQGPLPCVPGGCVEIGPRGGTLVCGKEALFVPRGAVPEETGFALAETELPAPLPEGARAASAVLHLTKSLPGRFERPVRVTVPIEADVPLDEVFACYWDADRERYQTVTVTARDAAARTITFETVHFTDFLAVYSLAADEKLKDVDTGFRPDKDGFDFANNDYVSKGTCLGMSVLASWYYSIHRGNPHLSEFLAAQHALSPNADLVARDMALTAQAALIPDAESLNVHSKDALDRAAKDGEIAVGLALHAQLRATNAPQIIVLEGATPDDSHAVVAYAYDHGKFETYDPNDPRQTKTFKFDKKHGWREWNGTAFTGALHVAAVSFSTYAADVDLQGILDRAVAEGGPVNYYAQVSFDSVVSKDGHIIIEGHVTEAIRSVETVALVVGEKMLAMGDIDRNRGFHLEVAADDLAKATAKEHAAPAVEVGDWGDFGGAAALPEPVTPGLVSVVGGRQ